MPDRESPPLVTQVKVRLDVGNAALCTARSYGQLASLNAPEAVIALVDRKEAVPLNWT